MKLFRKRNNKGVTVEASNDLGKEIYFKNAISFKTVQKLQEDVFVGIEKDYQSNVNLEETFFDELKKSN